MRSGAFTNRRRVAVLAAALAVLPAAAQAQTRENNRAVHAFISAVDLGEIQQSVVAHQRATNPEVHRYASMMIADHGGAMHGREARLGQENQGILGQGMTMEEYRAAGQGPLPPAYGPGNGGNASGGSVPEGQKATSTARASDGTGVGELPPAYGPGNGVAQTQNTQAGTTHAGHGNMAAAQQTREGRAAQAAGNMPERATLSPELLAAVEAALREHPVSRPVVQANARNLSVLRGVTPPQFDATYMDAQIAAHRYALTNLDRMISQGGVSDEMMGIMRATRATVATHLELAQAIRGRLQ
jgi:predicted outer membrane protein